MTFFSDRRQFRRPLIFCLLFLAAAPQLQTYDQLLHAIRETRAASQQRIEQAVEQEKVREAWETGKLIQEHILLNKNRANYGEQVILRLSDDLGISRSEINRMVKFARIYSIGAAPHQLSWAHYRELIVVDDSEKREEIAKEAVSKKWSQKKLRGEIKKRKLVVDNLPAEELLETKPGKIGNCRIVKLNGKLKIDLGFDVYYNLPPGNGKLFKEGDIVVIPAKAGIHGIELSQNSTLEDLYTYNAQVTQAYDGDTFHALIELGFGITVQQRLRLRQLDAPEIISTEGKQAQKFLEKILMRDKGVVIIKTEKSADQHGRYIVDVWVKGKDINPELFETGHLTVRGDE